MSAEVHCTECDWEGDWSEVRYRNPQDAESQICPGCGQHAGPDGCLAEGPQTWQCGAPATLDAAIAASSALDPLGSRKPDDSLRVPTWDEREAERKRVAERIASMGRVGS